MFVFSGFQKNLQIFFMRLSFLIFFSLSQLFDLNKLEKYLVNKRKIDE